MENGRMDNILEDLSVESVVRAMEANLASWVAIFGKLGKRVDDNPPGVIRAVVDIPNALFNSILETRLEEKQVLPAIEAITADARRRQVPVLWCLGPSSRPTDLGKQLEAHGFILEDDPPGMAVELGKLNENLRMAAGINVRQVIDEAMWWEWSRTMLVAFGAAPGPSRSLDGWHDMLSTVEDHSVLAYTAYLDGKAVATSLMYLAAGVAGIYAVATIPEARRKGIGAQVTLYPLLEARSRGYKAGVLEASEMGEGVYRSLGFNTYCRIQSYRFNP